MQASQGTFAFNRFLRLCWAEGLANWKSLGLYTGITTLICTLIAYNSFPSDSGASSYFFLGLLTVILFLYLMGLSGYLACNSVKPLKQRDSACQSLMLPASRVEKFTLILFFYGFIMPLFLWLLVGTSGYFLYSFSDTFKAFMGGSKIVLTYQADKSIIIFALAILFNQSYFFAGSMFLKKRSFAKLIFISIAFQMITTWIIQKTFGDLQISETFNKLLAEALSGENYGKDFWIITSLLGGGAALFIGIMWQKFRRHVMP